MKKREAPTEDLRAQRAAKRQLRWVQQVPVDGEAVMEFAGFTQLEPMPLEPPFLTEETRAARRAREAQIQRLTDEEAELDLRMIRAKYTAALNERASKLGRPLSFDELFDTDNEEEEEIKPMLEDEWQHDELPF